jgi:hypothetical protein
MFAAPSSLRIVRNQRLRALAVTSAAFAGDA